MSRFNPADKHTRAASGVLCLRSFGVGVPATLFARTKRRWANSSSCLTSNPSTRSPWRAGQATRAGRRGDRV